MSEVLFEEQPTGPSMSARDYFMVVTRHRLLITVVAVVVTTIAVLYSSTRTPIYQSRSEVLVSSFQRTSEASLSPGGGGAGSLDTELRLMTSAPVRDRVAAQLGLAPSDPRLLGVQVSQVDSTSIVQIVATDQDPVIAASVSNAYATAYLDSRRDRVLSRIVTARRAIDEEITQLESDLTDVDARIAARRDGRGELVIGARDELRELERELEALQLERDDVADDPASRLAVVQGRIVALDAQIRTLQLAIQDDDEKLTALAGAGATSLTDPRLAIIDRRIAVTSQRDALGTREAIVARRDAAAPGSAAQVLAIDTLRRWDDLNIQYEELGDDLEDASEIQLARDRRLSELSRATNQRNALARDEANLTPAAVLALEELDLAIEVLTERIADRAAEIEQVVTTPTIDDSSLRLERDVLFSRLSAFISQRAALVEDSSGLTDGGEVLVRGSVPTRPISPQPVRTGFLALFLGVGLGVGIAAARDYLEDAIRDDLDVRRATSGRPLLGRIPEWIIPGPTRDGIVTLLDPSSVAAESYRELSANVRFMALSGLRQEREDAAVAEDLDPHDASNRRPLGRGVMLASPTANNGKTATAVNLAVASARAGQRVVIVDADLRRPRVASLFGLGRLRGLSDLLAERGNVDDYVVNVGVPNLLVLPAGTLPPNPADVLASSQLDVVYRQLQDRFDLILIDSPAVLAVPDALEVGRLVDWALLVMQHTVSTRREVVGTIERLEQVGVRIEGGVLNAIDTRSDAYYYYYTYYHRLEYGASPDGSPADGTFVPRGTGPRVPIGPGAPGLGSRDRVLVPAAPPRGGVLRRLGLFDSDRDAGGEPRSSRDSGRNGRGRGGIIGGALGGALGGLGELLRGTEDVSGEFDEDEPYDA
jgi:polysaccharide biosynthesis transport protein